MMIVPLRGLHIACDRNQQEEISRSAVITSRMLYRDATLEKDWMAATPTSARVFMQRRRRSARQRDDCVIGVTDEYRLPVLQCSAEDLRSLQRVG